MKLFDKLKKQDDNALRSGNMERVPSRMIAIAHKGEDIADRDAVLARLHDTDEIKILSNVPPLRVTYKDREYVIETADVDLFADENDPALRGLDDDEVRLILETDFGLGTIMTFSDNGMDSFHLQVKIMDMLVPHMAALIDETAHRIFSGKWVEMTAASQVAPSPTNLFTVHAVTDEDETSVWLHTHGLNRCGTIELEILGANTENYDIFLTSLEEMAQRLVGDNRFIDEMEPLLIGAAGSGRDIVVTWKRSEWALRDLPDGILGSKDDRDEEHSLNMGAVYLYESDDDVFHGKTTPILQWEDDIRRNVIYYKTTAETQRMRALAQERIVYLRKLFQTYQTSDSDLSALIKIGLTPDAEFGFDEGQHEYIWFQADDLRDDGFTATLTQDAFYVKGMVTGVQKDFTYDDIVDWRVYIDDVTYSPDNIYHIIDQLQD